jgi:hypothetical protein
MNYIQTLKDSLHLFRATKLIWVFGFLSLLSTVPLPLYQYARAAPTFACVALFVIFTLSIVSLSANGSLIYIIQQASLNNNLTFSQAWFQGKSKVFRLIGVIFLSIPIILIAIFFLRLISTSAPRSPILWLYAFIQNIFISSFLIFGYCAIMIDDTKAWAAAWTSFLITINNIFRVSVIVGVLFLIRLLLIGLFVAILASGLLKVGLPTQLALDYLTYQKLIAIPIISWANWVVSIFLSPLQTIILTFGYIKFTKDISYPVLVKKPNTA